MFFNLALTSWDSWVLTYVIKVLFRLIAVGDPAQLPPTLSHFGAEVDDEQSNSTKNDSFNEINTQTHDDEPSKSSSDLRRCKARFLYD